MKRIRNTGFIKETLNDSDWFKMFGMEVAFDSCQRLSRVRFNDPWFINSLPGRGVRGRSPGGGAPHTPAPGRSAGRSGAASSPGSGTHRCRGTLTDR